MYRMSFEQLASIGELLGGIGVIATLLFLAVEIRSNSRILKANAKTAGMESFAYYNELLATDPILAPLMDTLLEEGFDSFDSVERFRVTLAIRSLVQRNEAQYFQYTEGLIDEEFWGQRRKWLKGFLDTPALQEWWEVESKSAQVTEQFIRHINSTTTKIDLGRTGQLRDDT